MCVITEVVDVAVPAEITRQRCGERGLLSYVFPALTTVRRIGYGLYQCSIEIAQQREHLAIHVTDSNNAEGTHWHALARAHSGSAHCRPLQGGRSRVEVRICYNPDDFALACDDVRQALREGMQRLRLALVRTDEIAPIDGTAQPMVIPAPLPREREYP